MESEILFSEKVFINWISAEGGPSGKQFPFEETEKWGGTYLQNIAKTKKAVRNGVPDDETYQEKIAKPAIDRVRKTLRDGMVSRKGLSKEVILKLMEAKMKKKGMAEKYRENLKKGYREFDQGDLNNAMVRHHLKKCFGVERFREAIENAIGWLAPFIQPGKQGGFRLKFGNQVKRSGKLISDLAYDPKYRKIENDKINALITQYLKKEIVPFETGGASHCDFAPILDSVRPFDSKEVLDIKYEIYKHFLGSEQANRVRAVWTVKDYQYPLNPEEYIGHPEKPAYFDMELDVQVSKKD